MAGQQQFSLGPLDHYARSCYPSFCIYFGLSDDAEPGQIFVTLQDGLRRTLEQHPWLGGTVHLQASDTPGWRPGQLEVRWYPQSAVNGDGVDALPQLRFKQLETDLTYEDLEASGFPLDTFTHEELLWVPLFSPIDAQHSPTVLAAQASFLPGACLLTLSINHTVCDGTAVLDILKLWAANCHELQGGPPAEVSGPVNVDRARIDGIWKREGSGRAISDLGPEVWKMMDLDPATLTVKQESTSANDIEPPAATSVQSPRMQAAMFYVSKSQFTELRKRCIEGAKSSPSSSLSGMDALSALIWRSLAKAHRLAAVEGGRAAAELDTSEAQLHMALDGRPNFSHAMPAPYLGNLTLINQCRRTLSSLTADETSLGHVALDIRAVAESATHEALLDAYAIARSIKDLSVLPHGKGLAAFDNVISSLIMYPLEDLHFGGHVWVDGGRPQAVRPLMSQWNTSGRICFVLPRKTNGGVEFVLNALPDEMALLLRDVDFSHFTTCYL
ncbi:hypothetical protein NX059_011072 [Plenodomus lindquistii]|nr:hypothetical protein NX059_011072 [Plenodomus lindquistii]